MSITVNCHRYVAYKDGREFVHECDGSDCRVLEESEAAVKNAALLTILRGQEVDQ